MIVQLLTEHHLVFLSLKRGCGGSSDYTCQNATLLEITCCGSIMKLQNWIDWKLEVPVILKNPLSTQSVWPVRSMCSYSVKYDNSL